MEFHTPQQAVISSGGLLAYGFLMPEGSPSPSSERENLFRDPEGKARTCGLRRSVMTLPDTKGSGS